MYFVLKELSIRHLNTLFYSGVMNLVGERGPARNMARKAAKPVIRKVLSTFIDSKLYGFSEASCR